MFESGAENVKEREGINRDVQMMIRGECDRVRKFGQDDLPDIITPRRQPEPNQTEEK